MRTVAGDEAALRRLVELDVISPNQAEAVRGALRENREALPARWLSEVAAYVGGVFLLGGGAILLATSWERFTDPVRAGVLGGVAVLLGAAGLGVAAGPAGLRRLRGAAPGARHRIAMVLFALAAGPAAGAGGVAVDEHAGVAAGAAGLVVALAGYLALPGAPGLLATALMSVVLSLTTVADLSSEASFAVWWSVVATGAVWIVLAAAGVARPESVGLGVGAGIAFYGAQQMQGDPGAAAWAYGLTAAIGLACFVLYRWRRTPVLLVAGVVAMAVAAPEAVWDWTGGAAGGAVILLVAGAALLLSGGLGLGVWRRAATSRNISTNGNISTTGNVPTGRPPN
ncbi:hypothetical protein ACN27G_09860 [Plantactinospora sp. WMMB334]|uniref:hypothetical protein n=1 Tax=Plantactinospora sp. WMMB334 TaxID=3404119 RepID=UPI003B935504